MMVIERQFLTSDRNHKVFMKMLIKVRTRKGKMNGTQCKIILFATVRGGKTAQLAANHRKFYFRIGVMLNRHNYAPDWAPLEKEAPCMF